MWETHLRTAATELEKIWWRLLGKLFENYCGTVGSYWLSWAVLLEDFGMLVFLVNLAVLGSAGAQDLITPCR